MSKISDQTHSGTFTIKGRDILGNLKVAGDKSDLHLYDKDFFHIGDDASDCIHGTLHDLTKVSLFQNICPGTGSQGGKAGHISVAHAFPHYVISGDYHLLPDAKVITRIDFRINDADMLFYDHDAFGEVIRSARFIEQIANANGEVRGKKVETGPYPHIFYFTGMYSMAKIPTAIGTVTADHSPSYRWPGPWGIEFNNRIVTGLDFDTPLDFTTALRRLIDLQRYLELLIGRPQNLTDVTLTVPVEGEEHPPRLSVDWSLLNSYDYSDEDRRPQPHDMLIEPIAAKEQFSDVTAKYFGRSDTWETARMRFATNFDKHRHYTIGRLVSAANIFDILPDVTYGAPPVLPSEIQEARTKAREIFKSLPASGDRESILSALGRLGKWSLKKKIASRLEKFLPVVVHKLPELGMVTERAVDCRNFFVHGGDRKFDYIKHERLLWFFVDTLEFVFAASDLTEAGWDVKAWVDKRTSLSHRFGGYVFEYLADLKLLKQALAEGPP
jgi:hypothetical protein